MNEGYIDREQAVQSVRRLVADTSLSPKDLFDEVAAAGYNQHTLDRKAELLTADLDSLIGQDLEESLRSRLVGLRDAITKLLMET